jgi:redox-sensitive bicupin YhaK (pirin superfamily)
MIEIIIPYRSASIGAFDVRRVLPFRKRRAVGPFVFVDDFGPVEIVSGQTMDVLPHPHIGLATVTYLFSGKMTHRDSIGSVQIIEPGEVNWMTAGRGVVHSERASDAGNTPGESLIGLQTWVALPENLEETEPSFVHHKSAELPVTDGDGTTVKLILGAAFGVESPDEAVSQPLYAECTLGAGAVLTLPQYVQERSVYILDGELTIDGQAFHPGNMIVFTEASAVDLRAVTGAKFMLIGGDRLEKPRYMWWNFVSSRQDLIEQARIDWREGNFTPIPNETGRVPLPEGNFPKPQPL